MTSAAPGMSMNNGQGLVHLLQPQQQFIMLPQGNKGPQPITIFPSPLTSPPPVVNCLLQPQTQVIPLLPVNQPAHAQPSLSPIRQAVIPSLTSAASSSSSFTGLPYQNILGSATDKTSQAGHTGLPQVCQSVMFAGQVQPVLLPVLPVTSPNQTKRL